jgi:hypothetical protein
MEISVSVELPTKFSFMSWQVYKLPADRIYATYFGGDEKSGLAPDIESKNIWLKYLPKEKVLPFGCKVQCIDCWLSCISVPLACNTLSELFLI